MAEQEKKGWTPGERIGMGKGKYFVAGRDEGTGSIFVGSGDDNDFALHQSVTGFRRSEGENGGSVFDYTTEYGNRTDRYDANGVRTGTTNAYGTTLGRTSTIEIGKGSDEGDLSFRSTAKDSSGSVAWQREGTLMSGRHGRTGSPLVTTWDAAPAKPLPERSAEPLPERPAEQSAGSEVAYTTREGLGTLFDSKGRAIGVGGKEDRVVSDEQALRGFSYFPGTSRGKTPPANGSKAAGDLDSLIAALDRYGPAEKMSGERRLTAEEKTKWEASMTRARDAGRPVDGSQYRVDDATGDVYRRWSAFDLTDEERKWLKPGEGEDEEVAAIRAMFEHAKAGGKGARKVEDIRSLAWRLKRNRAIAKGGR